MQTVQYVINSNCHLRFCHHDQKSAFNTIYIDYKLQILIMNCYRTLMETEMGKFQAWSILTRK